MWYRRRQEKYKCQIETLQEDGENMSNLDGIKSEEFPDFATVIIFSNPQPKFTAVGLVSNRICFAFSKSEINSSFVIALLCNTANANPKAPDTPIAEAPLTTKVLITSAT